MSHMCQIEEGRAVCFQKGNQLMVREYDQFMGEGAVYKVKFCPECGFKIPKSEPAYLRTFIPPSEPDNSITQFSQSLSTAIHQMNHNVELMKAFMSSQNTQNQCFIDRELDLSKEISSLRRKVEDLTSIIQKAGL